jgi:hypothetical protein
VSRYLRPSHWMWAPGLCLATGSIISSGAGSLLLQHAIDGPADGPVRIGFLVGATLLGGALVWWAARLDSRRSDKAGWFLHCTAATSGYQRQRFESEDRAYRQWALRRSPLPHILPRLQVDVDRDDGILRYLEAVERDLEVAFGMSPSVSQQVYLLVNGVHEANFWLGWHLGSTFRRSRPLMALSFVADQPAAPGTDSHAVIDRVADDSVAHVAHRLIGLDLTRRGAPGQPQADGSVNVSISPSCLDGGIWKACQCGKPHQNAIIAIDPEVDLAGPPDHSPDENEAGDTNPVATVTRSPRMMEAITAIASKIGSDSVLWVVCDGIESSAEAYSAFLQAVLHAINEYTAPGGKRHIAYTGPVVLATLLGVRLANHGQWSFLAYRATGAYIEAPNPRARPASAVAR